MSTPATVGVLALQGDVPEHLAALRRVGATAVPVKRADELAHLDGLVIPGGESTTIGRLLVLYGLLDPVRDAVAAGLPVLGTCAGAILLARTILHADGRESDQPRVGRLDAVVRRNAFGRQVASCEADVSVAGLGVPAGGDRGSDHPAAVTRHLIRAAFIRAPWVESVGKGVEVLASVPTPVGERAVVVRQGRLLATAFHPEVTGDDRIHRWFAGTAAVYRRERHAGRG